MGGQQQQAAAESEMNPQGRSDVPGRISKRDQSPSPMIVNNTKHDRHAYRHVGHDGHFVGCLKVREARQANEVDGSERQYD